MHAVRTQCKVLYVGKYSNPSFGPLGGHLLAHPSTHGSYPMGLLSRDFGPDP